MNPKWRRFAPLGLVLSVLALLFAISLYIIQREWNLYVPISLALVVVGVAVYVLLDPDSFRRALKGRQMRHGSNAILLIIAFIGIIITVNYFTFGNSKRWDLTEDKTNTLAPETTDTLQKLPAPVMAKAFLTPRINPETTRNLLDNTSGAKVLRQVAAHFRRQCPKTVQLTLSDLHSAEPFFQSPTGRGARAAAAAIEKAFGRPAVFIRAGGTLPILSVFRRYLRGEITLAERLHEKRFRFGVCGAFVQLGEPLLRFVVRRRGLHDIEHIATRAGIDGWLLSSRVQGAHQNGADCPDVQRPRSDAPHAAHLDGNQSSRSTLIWHEGQPLT